MDYQKRLKNAAKKLSTEQLIKLQKQLNGR